jgi:hypothetical protein
MSSAYGNGNIDLLRTGMPTGYKSSQSIPVVTNVYNHSHSQNPKPVSHQHSYQHHFSQTSGNTLKSAGGSKPRDGS